MRQQRGVLWEKAKIMFSDASVSERETFSADKGSLLPCSVQTLQSTAAESKRMF